MPTKMHVPAIGNDNDGDVYIEWWYTASDTLSIRLSPEGIVNWALLNEDESHHGMFELPPAVIRFLERHYEEATDSTN